jgi:hypothetical protein
MKIALVGPGIMPIPPPGWGAVEILIWDYATVLREMGHQVDIINELRSHPSDQSGLHMPYCQRLVETVNNGDYDFVHVHYDCLYHLLPFFVCPKIAITSHYPYIDQLEKHRSDGYSKIYDFMIRQTGFLNLVLAEKDARALLASGARPEWIRTLKNGVKSDVFRYSPIATLDKTLYLGKITYRKNQTKYQPLKGVDFVGNCEDISFDIKRENYLGAWTREQVYHGLTNYTNLLLISEGEADPLVVKEALVAGLGVVINKGSSACLDVGVVGDYPDFVTVLEDEYLGNLEYIQRKIEENRQICRQEGKRKAIREYGIYWFDIKKVIEKYLSII